MKIDLGLKLWRRGYDALPEQRAAAGGGDVIDIRLAGRRAVAVRGRKNVERFYDEAEVMRAKAVPPPLAHLLFGKGAVHGLDGDEHRHRKAMFLELLDDDSVTAITKSAEAALDELFDQARGTTLTLFDLLAEAYGAAVMGWAGLQLDPVEVRRRSRQLAQIVDGFGFQGTAGARAVLARRALNAWAAQVVLDARSGDYRGTVVDSIAQHRSLDGRLLTPEVAGVELLNVLRPTVAVAFLSTFAALALDDHPQWRKRVVEDRDAAYAFAHEVRRVFPFVPALAGVATSDQDWDGHPVRRGQHIVLDVPAVNTDERTWENPESFLPERFFDRLIGQFDLVPQGGGPALGHRCPGEPLTNSLIAMTVAFLAGRSGWSLDRPTGPAYDRTRIPARPHLRVVRDS